jgi:hypothetical protein
MQFAHRNHYRPFFKKYIYIYIRACANLTHEGGCHPAGHNTSPGKLFVSLDKVSLASRIGNKNGSSSLLVNTEWAFDPPRLGLGQSGPAGGSSGTCYPSTPLQLSGASASSPPCITKSDDDPGNYDEVCREPV